MNILLIGNGFDLAHGLPTTYKDFLKFVKAFEICKEQGAYVEEKIASIELNGAIRNYLKNLFAENTEESRDTISELNDMVQGNFWITHFNKVKIRQNWIDFESEISKVIRCLDALRCTLHQKRTDGDRGALLSREDIDQVAFLWPEQKMSPASTRIGYNKISTKSEELLRDLNRLIRALEVYFSDCIDSVAVEKKLPDISSLNIDCLLSFNYTNTYERLYTDEGKNRSGKAITYDFLHGKAKHDSNVETSNLVLGIDEYLTEPERTRDNEFIRFKKFFQRIHKKTGCEYKKWIENMNTNPTRRMPNPVKDQLYILGHSLDMTDGEVLSELINTDSMYTTIFYHSKEAYANQIANLVKILGEDVLISKVYGKEPRIKFVQQADAK